MPQFEKVSSRYGAPMGRSESGYLETEMPRFVRLFRVRIDRGGYDDGGAYWGIGAPLFCAIDDDGSRKFTRASTRDQAAFILDIASPALKQPLSNWAQYGCALIDGCAPMPGGKTRADVIDWLKRCGARMGQPTTVKS